MGFFWANVKANIEGAVANAKMRYYEEKLRSDDYDEDEEEEEDEEEDYNEVQEKYESGSTKHITLSPFGSLKVYNYSNDESCADSVQDSPAANIRNNWKSILLVLQTEYNIQNMQMSTWIKPLRVENVEGNILNLLFENADDNEQEHSRNVRYVQKRFAELLSCAIAEYLDIQYTVKIN